MVVTLRSFSLSLLVFLAVTGDGGLFQPWLPSPLLAAAQTSLIEEYLTICLPVTLPINSAKPALVREHEAKGYYIPLQDGTNVFVRDESPAINNGVVVLVHGVPTSSYLYNKVVPYLVDTYGYRTIAFDFPGMGLSDKPAGPSERYTWQGLADSMTDLLVNQMGLFDINLVIHDIGGPVSALFLLESSASVKSVTILDTSWDGATFVPARPMNLLTLPVIDQLILTIGFTPCFFWLSSPGSTVSSFESLSLQEAEAWIWLLKQGDGGSAFLDIMKGFNLTQAYSDRVRDGLGTGGPIQLPLQIVWAENEEFIEDSQREYLEDNFNIRRTVFLPGYHFFQMDSPGEMAQSIHEFIVSV